MKMPRLLRTPPNFWHKVGQNRPGLTAPSLVKVFDARGQLIRTEKPLSYQALAARQAKARAKAKELREEEICQLRHLTIAKPNQRAG